MRTKILHITLLFLCISSYAFGQKIKNSDSLPSLLIAYCSSSNDSVEKPIQKDWVQIDIDIITDIINNIPAKGNTLKGIKSLVPHFIDGKCNCSSITYELGYGLKSTKHTIHGGYGSCTVTALYFDSLVLKIRLTIKNNKEILERFLIDSIELPFSCKNGIPTYDKIYSENIKLYKQHYDEIFIESNDTIYRRKTAIDYFADIYYGGTFEKPYYIRIGLGRNTFNNLRYFIVNKDTTALESLLYCPSPTSRLFAARSLMYMQEKYDYVPGSLINERINDVILSSQLIRSGILSCSRCIYEYDYYDIVNDFELLLLTE